MRESDDGTDQYIGSSKQSRCELDLVRFYADRRRVIPRGQLAAGDDVLLGQLWLQQRMVNGFGELFEREGSEVERHLSIHFAPSNFCLAQIAAPINPALL